MKMSISLSRKAVAVLRERAKGTGQDLETYASGFLERSVLAASRLEELTERLNGNLAVARTLSGEVRQVVEQAKREERVKKRLGKRRET